MREQRYIRLGNLRVPITGRTLLAVVREDRGRPRLASGPRRDQVVLVTRTAGVVLDAVTSFKVFTSLPQPQFHRSLQDGATGGCHA